MISHTAVTQRMQIHYLEAETTAKLQRTCYTLLTASGKDQVWPSPQDPAASTSRYRFSYTTTVRNQFCTQLQPKHNKGCGMQQVSCAADAVRQGCCTVVSAYDSSMEPRGTSGKINRQMFHTYSHLANVPWCSRAQHLQKACPNFRCVHFCLLQDLLVQEHRCM